MVAGHETTSVALSWTLYELAREPQIQAKVREEINSVLCDDTEMTWDTIEELAYLEKVIKESLRRHPPACMTSRTAIADVTIGGYFIPKGTVVAFLIDSLQRTSKYWPNPDDFNPRRFDGKGLSEFSNVVPVDLNNYFVSVAELLVNRLMSLLLPQCTSQVITRLRLSRSSTTLTWLTIFVAVLPASYWIRESREKLIPIKVL